MYSWRKKKLCPKTKVAQIKTLACCIIHLHQSNGSMFPKLLPEFLVLETEVVSHSRCVWKPDRLSLTSCFLRAWLYASSHPSDYLLPCIHPSIHSSVRPPTHSLPSSNQLGDSPGAPAKRSIRVPQAFVRCLLRIGGILVSLGLTE